MSPPPDSAPASTSAAPAGTLPAPDMRPRRRNVALTIAIVALLYALVLVYPPLRLGALAFGWRPGSVELLVLVLAPLLLRVAHEWWPNAATRLVASWTMTWLGACFLALVLLLPTELALLAGAPARTAGLAAFGGALLLAAWGLFNAQWLRVRRVPLPGHGKASGRIAQISDVHVGSRSPRLVGRIVRRLEALQPDLVLITGDFIDFRNVGQDELAALARLRMPVYFVIGNHERYVDLEAICGRLRRLGVRVLRNAAHAEGGFHLLGIDDAERRDTVARVLPTLPRDASRYQILLYHRPDGLEAAAEAGIDLMLCGHTHNGQIVPFNYIVKRVFPRIVGLHRLAATTLYVSPGTGTWGPVLRLGSGSEITVFEID